eukprot:387949-Prorocentrum_minimum.AAC.1
MERASPRSSKPMSGFPPPSSVLCTPPDPLPPLAAAPLPLADAATPGSTVRRRYAPISERGRLDTRLSGAFQ